MKTNVYIDGYNLYYGLLQGGQYKWLDVVSLFVNGICRQQDPQATVTRVNYFSSRVRARFAHHGQASMNSQASYIRAHQQLYPHQFNAEMSSHAVGTINAIAYGGKAVDLRNRVEVWRVEEKQTDVHIGTMMYRDVAMSDVQQIVLCSNDSDMLPALRFIRSDFPKIKIGLVFPAKSEIFSRELDACSDWTRKSIAEEELAKFQLPAQIATHKKPIKKPSYW